MIDWYHVESKFDMRLRVSSNVIVSNRKKETSSCFIRKQSLGKLSTDILETEMAINHLLY